MLDGFLTDCRNFEYRKSYITYKIWAPPRPTWLLQIFPNEIFLKIQNRVSASIMESIADNMARYYHKYWYAFATRREM